MARKTTGRGAAPPDDDSALWRQIAGTVKPLRRRTSPPAVQSDETEAPKATATPKPRSPARKPGAAAPTLLPRQVEQPLMPGRVAGLDKRTAQRLRRGQLPIEGRIDLHGMTQAEAHANLLRFVTASAKAGRRCVLVITGKGLRGSAGTGVLRSELPRWLNEPVLRPLILSFAPAQPKDGGGGAFYVYLRKARAPQP